MSIPNKNKKKISQGDLKRFMNEHKNQLNQNAKKIESPLAKYPFFFNIISSNCFFFTVYL